MRFHRHSKLHRLLIQFRFLKKNFVGINFRGLDKSKHFAGTNFRDFVRKPRKLVPAKISTIKVYNIEMLYKARNEAIKFYDDYSLMMSEANSKAKQNETKGTELKILTPKQMLQRLPIALAQVKADDNSENLLNEIRQIIYSLYQSKEITKKVYNNLIKSL